MILGNLTMEAALIPEALLHLADLQEEEVVLFSEPLLTLVNLLVEGVLTWEMGSLAALDNQVLCL